MKIIRIALVAVVLLITLSGCDLLPTVSVQNSLPCDRPCAEDFDVSAEYVEEAEGIYGYNIQITSKGSPTRERIEEIARQFHALHPQNRVFLLFYRSNQTSFSSSVPSTWNDPSGPGIVSGDWLARADFIPEQEPWYRWNIPR